MPLLYAPSRFIGALVPWTINFAYVHLGSELGFRLSAGRTPLLIAMAGFAIFVLGGRPLQQGYDIRIDSTQRQALDFISQLPTSALIAGWPCGLINDILLSPSPSPFKL